MSSTRRPLVIWGTGGHAISVLETALAAGNREIFFADENASESQFEGFPCVDLAKLSQETIPLRLVVAIGDNSTRKRVVTEITTSLKNFSLDTLLHPSATLASNVTVGPGTVVLQGAVIGAKCHIGANCVVNTRASLDHESSMGDFSSLAPGVVIGGRVTIGESCFIGIGTVVRHSSRIGQDTVVGSASYVHGDLPEKVVAYGIPAKVIRQRSGDDPYLT